MPTHESDVREYNNFMSGTMKPATTRAIVVSNVDPLFAGRVKVWIPSIHGPTPYDPDGISQGDPDTEEFYTSFGGAIVDSTKFKDPSTIIGLPWASVLSHNLGPISDINSGLTTSAGIFSTPAPGTEVIIMFENNDPKLPIVVGSIIHANEFRHSMSNPFEYLPGVNLSEPAQTQNPSNASEVVNSSGDSYSVLAPQVYNLRTTSGSTLFISDSTLSRSIVLEGSIGYLERSTLTEVDIATLDRIYPAFPTTASAAFAKRSVISSSGASPLLSPTNFVGSDAISGVGITSVTPSSAVNVPTTEQATGNNSVISQALQDCANSSTIKRTLPLAGRFERSGGKDGLLHAPRTYRNGIHHGIDIRATGGKVPLIAPIDCFPLAWKQHAVGASLLVLGIDGYAHAFEHLSSIDPKIKKMIDSGIATKVDIGTSLGTAGIVLRTAGNTGPHLHWEVWNASNVRTTNGIISSRQAAWNRQSTIDGLSDWIKYAKTSFTAFNNNNVNISVEGSPEQVADIYTNSATQFASEDAPNLSKIGGLEISLVPGKETVTIRHPSGSFIGFDPDGNINIYSCGDINFRANRSITYDVLGAILENAYAKYTRIRTVLRSWARLTKGYNDYPAVATSSMPEFFSRVDNCRAFDMTTALASTVNNGFIVDSDGNLVSPASLQNSTSPSDIKPYKTSPSKANYNFDEIRWNTLISTFYNALITNQDILDLPTIKAMMYVESNADSNFTSGNSANVGLYGITSSMLTAVGKTTTNLSDYRGTADINAKANIDVFFQYLVKISSLLNKYFNEGVNGAILTVGKNISNKDFKFIILFAYKHGVEQTKQLINNHITIDTTNPKLTYAQLENAAIIQRVDNSILSYVPTVDKASQSVK
jgi:hypothetical protein